MTTSVVSARRHTDRGPFTDRQVRQFQQLLPHMRRSLQFHGLLLTAGIKANGFAAALDQFPVAVFLLDVHCTVLDYNRGARELVADLHAPIQIREKRLYALRSSDSRELKEAVRLGAISLRDVKASPPYLRFNWRDGHRVLTLMPVPIAPSLIGAARNLILLFCRETSASFIDPSRLQRQFGFTPAESQLAAAIAEGNTLEEFAVRRGISLGTARTQLKSAMNKVDAHSQAQLVGTVLRSLSALVKGV